MFAYVDRHTSQPLIGICDAVSLVGFASVSINSPISFWSSCSLDSLARSNCVRTPVVVFHTPREDTVGEADIIPSRSASQVAPPTPRASSAPLPSLPPYTSSHLTSLAHHVKTIPVQARSTGSVTRARFRRPISRRSLTPDITHTSQARVQWASRGGRKRHSIEKTSAERSISPLQSRPPLRAGSVRRLQGEHHRRSVACPQRQAYLELT